MFDIGFWEMSLIFIVALVVVGPERLPKLARTTGLWLGKARAMVQTVKSDIDRELAAEELTRTLKEQAESVGLHEIIEETKDAVQEVNDSISDLEKDVPQVIDKK